MSHDEASKTRQGGLSDTAASFEKLARIYQTENPNDGYKALRLYIEKPNPDCSAFSNIQSGFGRDNKSKCGLKIDAWVSISLYR